MGCSNVLIGCGRRRPDAQATSASGVSAGICGSSEGRQRVRQALRRWRSGRAPAATETVNATTADVGHGTAVAGAQPDQASRRSQLQSAAVFGAPGTKEHYGWVAL